MVILGLLSSCFSPVVDIIPLGSLSVSVPGSAGRGTVFPAFVSEITHYKGVMVLAGQPTSTLVSPVATPSLNFTNLVPGDWDLTITAYKGDPDVGGLLIGGAPPITVTITSGTTSNVSVDVGPLNSGSGTLSVIVTWPAGKADEATLKVYGTLDDYLTAAAPLMSTPLTQTGPTGTSFLLGSRPAGQYVLALQLANGGVSLPNTFLESVFIYGNLDSVWNVSPTAEDFLGTLSAPTSGGAVSDFRGNVTLSWLDNSNLETGYQVEYKESASGTWIPLGTATVPGATSQVISGLKESTAYDFQVYGVNSLFQTQSSPLSVPLTTEVFKLFVDDSVATTGDGTQGSPFKTIGEALNAALSGDEIFIMQGNYSEAITIDGTMSHQGNITLAGGYAQGVWVNPMPLEFQTYIQSPTSGVEGVLQVINVVAPHQTTLFGLIIQGAEGVGDRTTLRISNSNLTMDRSYLLGGSDGGTGRVLHLLGDGTTNTSVNILNTTLKAGENINLPYDQFSLGIDVDSTYRGILSLDAATVKLGVSTDSAYGLRVGTTSATVDMVNSQVDTGLINGATGGSYNIYSLGQGPLNISGTKINISGGDRPAFGIYLDPTVTHTAPVISKNNIHIYTSNNSSVGIQLDGTITGNSLIEKNRFVLDGRGSQPTTGVLLKSGTTRVVNNFIQSPGNFSGAYVYLLELQAGTSQPGAEIWNNTLLSTGQTIASFHYIHNTANGTLDITNNLFANTSEYEDGYGIYLGAPTDSRPQVLRNNAFHKVYNLLYNLSPEKSVYDQAQLNTAADTTLSGTGTASGNLMVNPKLFVPDPQGDPELYTYSEYSPASLYTGGWDLSAQVPTDLLENSRTPGNGLSIGAIEREIALFGDGLLAEWKFEAFDTSSYFETSGNLQAHNLSSGGGYVYNTVYTRTSQTGFTSANHSSSGGLYNRTLLPDLTGKALSLSLWLGELDTQAIAASPGQPLIDNLDINSFAGWGLYYQNIDGNTPELRVYTGYSGGLQTALTLNLNSVTLYRWNHLALVFGGIVSTSPVTLYLNGVSVATGSVTQNFNWHAGDSDADTFPDGLGLGVKNSNFSTWTVVNMDDVRIFDSPLTAAKIGGMMGEGGYVPDTSPPPQISVIGYRPSVVSNASTVNLEWNPQANTEPLWKLIVDWDGPGVLTPVNVGLESNPNKDKETNFSLTLTAGTNHTIYVTAVDKNGNSAPQQTLTTLVTNASSPQIDVNYNDPTEYTYSLDITDQNTVTPTIPLEYDRTKNPLDTWTFTLSMDFNPNYANVPIPATGVKWYLDGTLRLGVGEDGPALTLSSATLSALSLGRHGLTARFLNTANGLYYSQRTTFLVVEN